jgi:hypothetical protein
LIPECINLLKYVESNFHQQQDKKNISMLINRLKWYLKWKQLKSNPLPKDKLEVIFNSIEKIAEKEQEKLYYELEKDYVIKEEKLQRKNKLTKI